MYTSKSDDIKYHETKWAVFRDMNVQYNESKQLNFERLI